jgi:malate dehydrogenase (quinone)
MDHYPFYWRFTGASTVSIMIDVVGRCFKEELASPEWQEKK